MGKLLDALLSLTTSEKNSSKFFYSYLLVKCVSLNLIILHGANCSACKLYA